MKLRLTDARPGDGGGQVHKGYRDALDGIWPALSEHIGGIARACADPPTFWLTGHSLGGALATLAAHRFESEEAGDEMSGRIKGLYTFGSPRVGDDRFRDSLGVKAYRCVTENDFVMHLPPKLIASRDYRHVGEFRCVDAQGRITGGQSLWERKKRAVAGPISRLNRLLRRSDPSKDEDARAPAGIRGLIRSLEDHAPIRYAERFRRALDRDE